MPPDEQFPLQKCDADWRAELTPEAYQVLRKHGTERAGSNPLNHEARAGAFRCAGCGQPLFDSYSKFDSGTGWPSFFQPLPGAVGTREDRGCSRTARKFTARAAAGTWVTCSPTDPSLPVSVTA